MVFICYEKCNTCKKARKFLDDHNIKYTSRDIKAQNPSMKELKEWHELSGLELRRFFNTSGTKYKELSLKDKLPSMNDTEKYMLLSTDGMLVKRPILIGQGFVLLGFKQDEWEKILL